MNNPVLKILLYLTIFIVLNGYSFSIFTMAQVKSNIEISLSQGLVPQYNWDTGDPYPANLVLTITGAEAIQQADFAFQLGPFDSPEITAGDPQFLSQYSYSGNLLKLALQRNTETSESHISQFTIKMISIKKPYNFQLGFGSIPFLEVNIIDRNGKQVDNFSLSQGSWYRITDFITWIPIRILEKNILKPIENVYVTIIAIQENTGIECRLELHNYVFSNYFLTNKEGYTKIIYPPNPDYLYDIHGKVKPGINLTGKFRVKPTENTSIQFEPFEIELPLVILDRSVPNVQGTFQEVTIFVDSPSEVTFWHLYD